MYISLNWIKKYLDYPKGLDALTLGDKLTLHSVEIEGIEIMEKKFAKMVIGQIKEIKKHPDADKLSVCKVDVGDVEDLDIICGANNIYEGMLCIVALPGAKVRWHGQGDLVEMEVTQIRGVKSFGMICAPEEVGLQGILSFTDGVSDLTKENLNVKVGHKLPVALDLDDVIYELDNKSITHRPDMWGHYGLARDMAAFLEVDFKGEKLPVVESTNKKKIKVNFEDKKICSRYMTLVMDGIKVGSSPYWLRKALNSVGIRSINNIVDISNYVMLDVGHPLHAYDAGIADTEQINIRYAKPGETITTLDGKERKLEDTNVVVASDKEAMLLGGIMGGLKTEVNDKTKSIILEVGTFDPTITRKTGLSLGLRSDACIMYEKTLDPEIAEHALKKFVALVKEINPQAKVVSNIVDEYNHHYKVDPISFSADFLTERLGMRFPNSQIEDVLSRLGFGLKPKDNGWLVHVPSWRSTKDISIPEDLVEEVARIYGYDNITISLPSCPIDPPMQDKKHHLIRQTRQIMAAQGYQEVYNYSFISRKEQFFLGDDSKLYIELLNPVTDAHTLVRRNLIVGLLRNVGSNIKNDSDLKFYEIGKTYLREARGIKTDKTGSDYLPLQDDWLGVVWFAKSDDKPFYGIKGALSEYMSALKQDYELSWVEKPYPWVHPQRQAKIFISGNEVGYVGEIHPLLCRDFGVPERIAILEVNLRKISELDLNKKQFRLVNRFPTVKRDLSLVMDKKVLWRDIEVMIENIGKGMIREIKVFDIYEGDKVGTDKKSVAFHLVYQAVDRTLLAREVDKIEQEILKQSVKKFGAELRK